MKTQKTQIIAIAMLLLSAFSAEALIVLGDAGGANTYTVAPADDPGWNNVGYVRANWTWNQSRAGGVYIGDGWVLTAYHVIYFDAPTGIVFNADSNKAYPIDVASYVRLSTTNFTRLADSDSWINPTEAEVRDDWTANARLTAPSGADLAMFRLQEGHYPSIDPVHISEIPAQSLSQYINGYWYVENGTWKVQSGDRSVTAIATGRPKVNELSYWTTNLTATTLNATNMAYSGYYDYLENVGNQSASWYQPISRWGTNRIDALTATYDFGSPFGKTDCLRTTFTTNGEGIFQMARLDSGGGVFYKGSGQWELLGLLTAKTLPDDSSATERTAHPFESHSLICDLTRYREQIMRVTEWSDLAVHLSTNNENVVPTGREVQIDLSTTNQNLYTTLQPFTNTIVRTRKIQVLNQEKTSYIDQTEIISTNYIAVPELAAGNSTTNVFSFTPNRAGVWTVEVKTDSQNQIVESYERNNTASKTFYAGPDLLIERSSPAETNVAAESQASIDITIQNQGAEDITNSFRVGLYVFSANPESAPYWQTNIAALAASTSVTVTAHFATPTNIGSYFVVANADDYDSQNENEAVQEIFERNNQGDGDRRESYSILHVGPNLSASFSASGPVYATGGTTLQIDTIEQNSG
jgi:hypothetical protein